MRQAAVQRPAELAELGELRGAAGVLGRRQRAAEAEEGLGGRDGRGRERLLGEAELGLAGLQQLDVVRQLVDRLGLLAQLLLEAALLVLLRGGRGRGSRVSLGCRGIGLVG
jgi:hypothetical protein